MLALVAVGVAFVAGFGLAARMTSPGGSVIPRDVIGGGGGRATSSSGHVLNGTTGQMVAGVSTSPGGYTLVHGFQTSVGMGPAAVRRWELY